MTGVINLKVLTGLAPKALRFMGSGPSRECLLPRTSVQLVIPAVSSSQNFSTTSANASESRAFCTLIPGDGVWPELMKSMTEVVKASGAPVDFETNCLSAFSDANRKPVTVEDVVSSVTKNAVCIKGIISNPMKGDSASINYLFRSQLDLFANVVTIKTLQGVPTKHKDIDMLVIREQTEGEYSSLEHETVNGVIECYKIVTADKSKRIAKFAFDYATKHNRKKVTAVHKANIMKLGDGLFLKCCTEVAKLYPKIEFDAMIIDNCTMQMASNPYQFDVLVMGNLYGSIISNLGAGLVGGAGVVVGASYSADTVVYEPGSRHTYADAVGKDVANPTAIILCAAKMLNHINLSEYGTMIYEAVGKVIKSGKTLTKDLGGKASTQEYTSAVIGALK